jgi:hypothetical protein
MDMSRFAYFCSFLAGLLCAEAALRLVGARFATSFYAIDPDLGWSLRPGAEGDSVEEAVVRVKINAAGMRDDREHEIAKAAGVYRVAILGDSFAEAMQVPLERTFSKLLERDLAACRGGPVEVLNFGVQGYGTAQELLMWRLKAARYKPDAAVLLFYTGNDLYNNHRALNPTNADAAPYFAIDNGALRMLPALAQESAAREAWAGLVRYSRLAQMLSGAYYKFGRKAVRAREDANRARFGENYMDRLIYREPSHAEMREAWAVTEAALPLARDEVAQSGARFLLAIASSAIQVHPDGALRDEFLRHVNGSDLYYAENRLASAAAKHGIEVSILGQEMLRGNNAARLLHGFPGNLGKGHWNEAGHAMVSRILASRLCGR